jgi:hypothetical protein
MIRLFNSPVNVGYATENPGLNAMMVSEAPALNKPGQHDNSLTWLSDIRLDCLPM